VKKIFDPVVDRIIELVKGQMDDVKERGNKVAVRFLSNFVSFSNERTRGNTYYHLL
jgi:hypothetical protein